MEELMLLATWNVLTLSPGICYMERPNALTDRIPGGNHEGAEEARRRHCLSNGDKDCRRRSGVCGWSHVHPLGRHTTFPGGWSCHCSTSVTSWAAVSNRLLTARFTHRHGDLTIVAVYAPTKDASDAEKYEFYSSFETISASVGPHDQLIIAGDLNAVSGTDRTGFEQVVGPHESGSPNNNTARLLAFCFYAGISMVSSWFRRQDIWRWSWISNDGVTKKG